MVKAITSSRVWERIGLKRRLLIVIRESSTGRAAEILMAGMIANALKKVTLPSNFPTARELLEMYRAGVGPGVREVTSKGLRAVLVEVGDVDVLMALGSGRQLTGGGKNAFIELLANLLNERCYEQLVTTTISRLCRNSDLAGQLSKELKASKTVVHSAETSELKVWETSGSMTWAFFSVMSELEAQLITSRTSAGKMARGERGEWTFGFSPPPGWQVGPGGKLETDEEAAAAMRWLLREVGSGRTDWVRLAEELSGKFSLVTRRGNRPIAALADQTQHLKRTLLSDRWFKCYTDNKVTVELPTEFEEPLSCEFDLPEHPEPIATPELIERVRQVMTTHDDKWRARVGSRTRSTFAGRFRSTLPTSHLEGVELETTDGEETA